LTAAATATYSAPDIAPDAARLLLIRHGETEWNTEGRIQGFRDIALSDRGQRQAQVLARHLAVQAIDAVYASDLARAIATATPLAAQRGQAVRIDARLKERGFGLFEGSTYAEAEAKWPNEYAIWRQRDPGHALPGGESFRDARARVMACLEEIAQRHAGRTVALVTHGGVLDIIYRAAHGIPWETPRSHLLPNASINHVIARAPGPHLQVVAWADHAHLDAAGDELA
jgi:probable phosphoglycerate mutase